MSFLYFQPTQEELILFFRGAVKSVLFASGCRLFGDGCSQARPIDLQVYCPRTHHAVWDAFGKQMPERR